MDRVTLTIALLKKLDDLMKAFFFHTYPRLSQFWCCLLVVFVLTFDPAYLLSYVIGIVTCVYGLNRPQVANVMDPYLKKIFFNHPNIYYKTDLKVAAMSQRSLIESKNSSINHYTPANQQGGLLTETISEE